ncbi:dynamin family protein [Aquifex pyrophilus]
MKAVQEFVKVKNKLEEIINELFERGYLDEKRKDEILEKLKQEKIKLGIAGQMKYGKSTFINALIFRSPVLPTSDIPMTATLTYLEHGEIEEYEVEFFSKDEWEVIKHIAQASPDEKEREANQERVEEAELRLGKEIEKFLGKSHKISKEELSEYVGAEGKYTPITKSLRIKYPHEILKELVIVDTPGFNDPIVSREQEAEKFLKDADALIFMLYAGRPLDDTDKILLTEKIAQSGTGGIVIAVNKYDLLLKEKGSMEAVEEYLHRTYETIINDSEIGESVKKVLKKVPMLKLSSLMALLGYMPEKEIKEDDELNWYYENFKKDFPFLRTQNDFIKYSGLPEIEEELRRFIRENKIRILVNKIKTSLEGELEEKLLKLHRDKLKYEQEAYALEFNKKELEKRKRELEDFMEDDYYRIMSYSDIKEKIYRIFDETMEKAIAYLQDEFKRLDFGKPGFFDIGGYESKVSILVKDKAGEVERKTKELFNRAVKDAREELKKYVEEKIEDLRAHEIVRKYSKVSYKTLDDIKGSILSQIELKYNMELSEKLKSMNPNIVTLIITITINKNKEARIEQAQNYKYRAERELERSIELAFKTEKKGVEMKIKELILEPLKENVLYPIRDALKNALRMEEDRDRAIKEIGEKIKDINEKIEQVKSTKIKLSRELAAI